jgi:D-alanyl-D-alanine carboxypeptidase
LLSAALGVVSVLATAGPLLAHGGSPKPGSLPAADVAFIDRTVAAHMAQDGLPGVTVSVVAPGRGTFLRSYGVANTRTGRPLEPDQHYRIASVSKTFTATAILELVDQGRIRLDDTLDRYVKGVPNGDVITIRQLLGMRAGVFNWIDDQQFLAAYEADPLLPGWQPSHVIGILQRHAAEAAPPGQVTIYSDSNYVLLGLVIQRVTNQPAESFITEHVIEPLGLGETSFPRTPAMPQPFARGYDDSLGSLRDATYSHPRVPWTAGGMVSTVPDMTRYAGALASGAVLSKGALQERLAFTPLETGGPPSPFFVGYGLGVMRIGDWIGHDGAIFGYSGFVFTLPSEGATIVAMANKASTTGVAVTATWFDIASHLYPGSFPPA